MSTENVTNDIDMQEQEGSETGAQMLRYLVKNLSTNETYMVCSDFELEKGANVLFSSRYGNDIGIVLGKMRESGSCSECETTDCGRNPENQESASGNQQKEDGRGRQNKKRKRDRSEKKRSIYTVIRVANEQDLKRYEENRVKELEAFELCRKKIKQHKLEMKLVSAHYLQGESKVLFFFTADSRVDFRELVKDLVSVFKMRIELRQIGVRDESRVLGGLAVCGRDYCCHGITDKLKPVSIKMAKEQNLSLNSMKISGPCGRLLCCLSYEFDFYRREKKNLPSEGSRMKIQDEMFKITEVNILSKKIYLSSRDGRVLVVPFDKVSYNSGRKQWDIARDYLDQLLSG